MKHIILIGYMGCGKSSVGVKLSYRMKTTLIDTDKEIEKRQNCSISQIFDQQGEEAFRDMETAYLTELLQDKTRHIISTGGGLPVRPKNRELLKKLGTVVYLRAKPETIYERVKDDTTRPLLQCEDPKKRIEEMLESRREAYESSADLIVDTDDVSFEEIMDKIEKGLEEKMKILVINGPNLNFLGIRDKKIYGAQDYEYLKELIANKAKEVGCEIEVWQSNHEGAIIDRIQEAYFDGTEGIVINPGAYTHYSYAIHDALETIQVPKVEIHISDITKREEFRRVSVTKAACDHQIYGHGLDGYLEAIDFIVNGTLNKK